MRVEDLFFELAEPLRHGPFKEPLSGIQLDSRKVVPGSLFVALVGGQQDGHHFIHQAIQQGAVAILVEKAGAVPASYRGHVYVVESTRLLLPLLAQRFYGEPAKRLTCIGVTGTNGKTSVSYLIKHLLSCHQISTGLMGTIEHRLGEKSWPVELTTADVVGVHQRLAEFTRLSAKAAVMEVSSHALDQGRVDGVDFDVTVFTNLSRDHLDYHESMEEYFLAKSRLFTDLLPSSSKSAKCMVLNMDDEWIGQLQAPSGVRLLDFAFRGEASFLCDILSMSFTETRFSIVGPEFPRTEFCLPMLGEYNAYNAVSAILSCFALGLSPEKIAAALSSFPGVPGRMQRVPSKDTKRVALVDYAHSPDSLERALQSLHHIRKQERSSTKIAVVFGCGGDRDKGKRALMGRIAAEYADRVHVTSDNPRSEKPEKIISDIMSGVPRREVEKVKREVRRDKAIEQAVAEMSPGDVLLVAGKGHEKFQIVGERKLSFDDVLVTSQALDKGRE